MVTRWTPFDRARNYPDLGAHFCRGRTQSQDVPPTAASIASTTKAKKTKRPDDDVKEGVEWWDLTWGTVLKRTFEAYIRREAPNMYGEWLEWAT